MDSGNPASKFQDFVIVKDGCPEGWIWLMAFREIENLMPLKEPADKTKMFWTLLKGQDLSYFKHYLRRRLDAEDSELPDNDLLELLIGDIGLEYIPWRAISIQKYYMRRGLFMGPSTSVQQFIERLNELNCYLLFTLKNILSSWTKMRLLKFWIKPKILSCMK